ncbi:MAG: MFS transporter [Halobacteriota archaeon]
MRVAADGETERIHVFGSLCLLVFLVNFGRIVFAPLLDPFMGTFGVGEATVGLVATLAWLGSAVPRLPTGYLLLYLDRHRVVLLTGLLLAASSAFTATAESILHVGVGAFVMGSSSGAYFVAANPLVSELFPDRVGRVIGIHGTASQLAAVVAPLSIGLVIAVSTWRTVFWALSIVALVGTAGLYVAARRATLPTVQSGERRLLQSVRNQWPIVLTGVAIIGATGFVWNGFFNFYVSYLTATKGIGLGTAQTLLTVVFAAGVPAFWYTGRLADRMNHVTLMLAILIAFLSTLLVLTAVQSLPAVVAVSIVLGYVVHSLFPALDTYLLDNLPDTDRASAYAAYSASMMLIQAGASVVVGWLVENGFAYDTVYRSFVVGLFVIFVGLVWLRRADRLPEAARG